MIRSGGIQKTRPSKPIVYFDLIDNPYDRYLALLLLFFELAGYVVVIRFRKNFVGRWATSLVLRQCKRLHFVFKAPENQLSITNDPARAGFDFYLSHDYFGKDTSGHFIPMPMVDSFYEQEIYRLPGTLQHNSERSIKIFFAGRFTPEHYGRPEVPRYFHCFTRIQLLDLMRKNFNNVMPEISTAEDLAGELEMDVAIVDRDKANIKPRQLYGVLSRSRFFLAFPGVVMPLCHNVVEAMAFGCIPILQYAAHFHPALVPDENCLAFSDEETLRQAINTALSMDAENLRRMRRNVTSYYNKYLAPDAAVSRILQKKGHEKRLVLNAEYQSVRYLMIGKEIQQPS